jgi:hypothetical protein
MVTWRPWVPLRRASWGPGFGGNSGSHGRLDPVAVRLVKAALKSPPGTSSARICDICGFRRLRMNRLENLSTDLQDPHRSGTDSEGLLEEGCVQRRSRTASKADLSHGWRTQPESTKHWFPVGNPPKLSRNQTLSPLRPTHPKALRVQRIHGKSSKCQARSTLRMCKRLTIQHRHAVQFWANIPLQRTCPLRLAFSRSRGQSRLSFSIHGSSRVR